MATKTEIKALLKSMNLTEEDMDNYWNELIETNWKIKSLNDSFKTWRDMNTYIIAQLPTQKQKDIESAELKAKEEAEKAKAKLAKEQEEEYYDTHFEEIMIKKLPIKKNSQKEKLVI